VLPDCGSKRAQNRRFLRAAPGHWVGAMFYRIKSLIIFNSMKLFNCTNCGQLLYFENSHCEQCGLQLGFIAGELQLLPVIKHAPNSYSIFSRAADKRFRYCKNHDYYVCNWLVPEESQAEYCTACSLNRTIPNLSKLEYQQRWNVIENGKHRLVFQLLRLQLPVVNKITSFKEGLLFDFVADDETDGENKILTGHDNGVITLNIAEADDVEREMTRKGMAEVYRTVLGHFRHEIGHYYWDRLIDNTPFLSECRALFGDDTIDYGDALKVHYRDGAPPDWNRHFISAYASTHPWEDWAETWAHYLHIIDTLETAFSFGIRVDPHAASASANLYADIKTDPYQEKNFDTILQQWLPLTFALNSVNRSMGLQDLYPFVIPPEVVQKLKFIHKVCGVRRLQGV
jgi:hypothetical protein